MKKPCAKCEYSLSYNNRHYPSFNRCIICNKYKKYIEYLESKRKFAKGDAITSIDELLKQEWVIWNGSTRHIEVIKHNQLSVILRLLENGSLRKAVRKGK